MKVELNGKNKTHNVLQPFLGIKTKFTPKNEDAVLTEPLFPVPLSQQKISLKKATGLVKLLLGCYPQNEKSDHEVYINMMVSTFQRYTFEEGIQVIDGLTSTKKFTPTRAEVLEEFKNLPSQQIPFNATPSEWCEVSLKLKDQSPLWNKICHKIERMIGVFKFKRYFLEIETKELDSRIPTLIVPNKPTQHALEYDFRQWVDLAFEAEVANFKFINYEVKRDD